MKYIIILGDGMADEPIATLGNKTPLQVANKPNIDKIATLGCCGMLDTIPKGFAPGSEIANLSVYMCLHPITHEDITHFRLQVHFSWIGIFSNRHNRILGC